MHLKAESRATTAEALEALELARDGTDLMLRNPGLRMLLSLGVSLTQATRLLSSMLILYLFLSAINGQWSLFLSC